MPKNDDWKKGVMALSGQTLYAWVCRDTVTHNLISSDISEPTPKNLWDALAVQECGQKVRLRMRRKGGGQPVHLFMFWGTAWHCYEWLKERFDLQ